MKLIVCIADDRSKGFSFNNRRLSQDEEVRNRILKMTEGQNLWTTAYTLKQFLQKSSVTDYTKQHPQFLLSTDPIRMALPKDYVFLESGDLPEINDVKELIIYNWNRAYPYDKKLEFDFDRLKVKSTDVFIGKSHEEITETIYEVIPETIPNILKRLFQKK